MKKNAELTTGGHTCPTVNMLMLMIYLNVLKKNAELTTRFLKKENNRNIMTYENKICSRCTRRTYCIIFGNIQYCDACFEAVMNDPDSKPIMEQLLKNYGTN